MFCAGRRPVSETDRLPGTLIAASTRAAALVWPGLRPPACDVVRHLPCQHGEPATVERHRIVAPRGGRGGRGWRVGGGAWSAVGRLGGEGARAGRPLGSARRRDLAVAQRRARAEAPRRASGSRIKPPRDRRSAHSRWPLAVSYQRRDLRGAVRRPVARCPPRRAAAGAAGQPGADTVTTDARVTGAEPRPVGVLVHHGRGIEDAELVVLADGLASATRRLVAGSRPRARFAATRPGVGSLASARRFPSWVVLRRVGGAANASALFLSPTAASTGSPPPTLAKARMPLPGSTPR